MEVHKYEFVRHSHVLFCLGLLVLRAGLMYVALSIREQLYYYNVFLYDYVTVLTIYLLSSSSVFILLSLLGLSAGLTSRTRLFVTYSGTLAILYVIEIVLFGIAFNMWMNFSTAVEESVDYNIGNYKTNPNHIDYLQKTLVCCGKLKEDEWFDVISYIPFSCCPSRPPSNETFCSLIPPDFDYITRDTGCLKKLLEMPSDGLILVMSILISLCAVEMLSLCLSSYAARLIMTAAPAKNTSHANSKQLTNTDLNNSNFQNNIPNNMRKAETATALPKVKNEIHPTLKLDKSHPKIIKQTNA